MKGKRSDDVQGFAVLPRRWVVERTFGWLMRHRRLVRGYERTEASAKAWIHLAMIRIQLRRLASAPAYFHTFSDRLLARIVHKGIEQRSGESVRRLEITQPNEYATHRFFDYRL